ncbi:MAG: biliverdin-producing heme oxygenase [Planctomycetota bacterium]
MADQRRKHGAAKGPVHAALSEGTRDGHMALHRHAKLSRYQSAELTEHEYRELLKATFGFVASVEARRAALSVHADLGLDRSVARLHEDLKQLRIEVDAVPCANLGWLTDSPAVLGGLYVFHGSGFGGPMLAKSVAATLPSMPVRYLGGGVDREQWPKLLAALEQLPLEGPQLQAHLVAGASRVFAEYGAWVTENARFEAPSAEGADGR